MPIEGMYWVDEGYRDLHLMRGDQPVSVAARLKFSVHVGDDPFVMDYQNHHADVVLEFKPLFKGTTNGPLFEGHSLHVNTITGEVWADELAPPLPKNNFILEVTAIEGGETYRRFVRIHVHKKAVRMWLTPSTLTVRPSLDPPEKTGYRFTARAEFDDGTVGDVTLNHGLDWTPTDHVDSTRRLIIADTDAPGSEIEIRARFDFFFGSVLATGTMKVAEGWSSVANPPEVSIIPGGGWPGEIRPEEVPNVLFLGDGFREEDRTSFENITNGLVKKLKSDRLIRPFDLLATSINFWRTFVPASSTGISIRDEVNLYEEGGKTFAYTMPAVKRPEAGKPWTFNNLLYVVGLPVPADRAKSAATLRAEWAVQIDPDPGPNIKGDAIIERWKKLSDRTFVDELDSFPGMSYGHPPTAELDDNYSLNFHDDRGGITQALKPFYLALQNDNGVQLDGAKPVGELWAINDERFDFDNTDLVVLLAGIPGGRQLNAEGYIAMSTETEHMDFLVEKVPGRAAYRLLPAAPPAAATADSCRALSHELAHSFGCGDEYVETSGRYPTQNDSIPDSGNLETEEVAKDDAGHFQGSRIKWNWHRIAKAGVIEEPIVPSAGGFLITLRMGHGTQFETGDKVLLRFREFKEVLTRTPDLLRNALVGDDPPPAELEIISDPGPNFLLVSPVIAGSVTPETIRRFSRGSIVYLPKAAPESVRTAAYPYAEVVAKNIKDWITANDRPLTPKNCTGKTGDYVQTPTLTGIDLPGIDFCFSDKPKIVGLYEGGSLYACGIYHPTGKCMMRGDHEDSAEFCAVCRYVIVDFVNPFLHFQIDRDYDEIYPQG